jgi:dTDP-glucose 4,6-dehydratase/UDP-glucuronate decarboxylase
VGGWKGVLENLVKPLDAHFLRDASDVIENLGAKRGRFSGKRILLTGAAGFLGSQFMHFFAALNNSGRLKKPCKVVALDNLMRGAPDWLAPFRKRPDFQIASKDIIKAKKFPKADFIIHAASIASPIFYRKYPIETMDANVIGLRNLLEHAVARPPESILFFSSSEIYGDPDAANIPTPETFRGFVSCTGPRACYDESKRYGETLCVNFHQAHHVPVKIVRPFNNYGPGLKISDRRVLPDFFRDVLAGRDITLLSDGRATRTFCYISDAITGYLLALLSSHDGEPFNIGSDAPEISMRDLAQMAIDVSGAKSKVIYQKSGDAHYLTDNPQRRCPDLKKSRAMLGYAPRIGLREGLERTWAYYRDHSTATDA